MKKFVVLGIIGFVVGRIFLSTSFAGEVDVLIDKLVDKKVITPFEAQIIRDETKQQVAEEISQGKHPTLPDWVQNMKLKGDLRVRYQYERDATDTDAKERGRIRYRLGIMTKAGDVDVGAGFASGGDDPRSTNQTFQDTFETGDLRLDYAYVTYAPDYAKDVQLVAGKFPRKTYLWAPTDMLWDGDINPSGGSLHAQGSIMNNSGIGLIDNSEYVFNTGVWIMDENSHSDMGAPFLYYTQAGLAYKEEQVDATLMGTYYGFNNVQNRTLDWSAGTNTGATTALQYDYDAFGASAEIGAAELLGGLPFDIDERIALFADYIMNVDSSVQQRHGWALGTKFGNKKVKDPGSWQLKYQFVNLQKDAFLDTFPDSDRNGGGTDVRSHEVALEYALKKNVILGVDYYQTDWIKKASDTDHLLQLDLMVKF